MAVKLPNGAKPSKVMSKNANRPALRDASLEKDGDGWLLMATDGYRMTRLPVEAEGTDVPGPVPREAMATVEKTGRFEAAEFIEPLTKQGHTNGGLLFRRPTPDKPPEWAKKWKELHPAVKEKDQFKVALNARFLYELAQAIGADETVELTFDKSNNLRPITVEPLASSLSPGRGLLMPVRANQ